MGRDEGKVLVRPHFERRSIGDPHQTNSDAILSRFEIRNAPLPLLLVRFYL